MRFRSWYWVRRVVLGLAVTVAAEVLGADVSATAAPLVNPSFFGQPNTTYQEWDGFTSPAGPNPATIVNNSYGTPNWLDTTASTDGAFNIGPAPNAHIYSFGGVLNLQATIPTPTLSTGATTTLVLQAEVLGSPLDQTLFGVTYSGLVGDPVHPDHITEVNEGTASGGFGGGDFYYLIEWDSLPAAASYAVNYSPGASSSSQLSARVDTLTVAPAPPHLAGDANGDGIVNGQDIAVLASNWLHTGSNLPADLNKDGIVNGQDIAQIASNWLHTSGGGAQGTAVPEPATCILLGVGLSALLVWRQRTRTAFGS